MKKILLAVALLAIMWGVYQGDITGVLQKATFICLECVGIG